MCSIGQLAVLATGTWMAAHAPQPIDESPPVARLVHDPNNTVPVKKTKLFSAALLGRCSEALREGLTRVVRRITDESEQPDRPFLLHVDVDGGSARCLGWKGGERH